MAIRRYAAAGLTAAIGCLATACAVRESAPPAPAEASAPAPVAPAATGGGTVVYTVNRGGFNEIWLDEGDPGDPTLLTRPGRPEFDGIGFAGPALSPDAQWIAYAGSENTLEENLLDTDLFLMRRDGTDVRRLTSGTETDGAPAWSPDGKRIAFTRSVNVEGQPTRSWIAVLDLASGEVADLTSPATDATRHSLDGFPTYAPDGRTVAFLRTTVSASGFETAAIARDLETGEERVLVEDDALWLAWSPDGTRLAFASGRDRNGETCFHECRPNSEIYVADADGGNPTRLTDDPADDSAPAWSPDGTRILFASDRSNRDSHELRLWIVDAAGGEPRRFDRGPGEGAWVYDADWR